MTLSPPTFFFGSTISAAVEATEEEEAPTAEVQEVRLVVGIVLEILLIFSITLAAAAGNAGSLLGEDLSDLLSEIRIGEPKSSFISRFSVLPLVSAMMSRIQIRAIGSFSGYILTKI